MRKDSVAVLSVVACVFAAAVMFCVSVAALSPWSSQRAAPHVQYRNSTHELATVPALVFQNAQPFITKPAVAASMRKTWQTVATWFKAIDVPCVLAFGTLLGYARHNGRFIPWDDDIDVHVPVQYEPIVLSAAARRAAAKAGLHLRVNESGILKLYLAAAVHGVLPAHFPFVDVFFLGGDARADTTEHATMLRLAHHSATHLRIRLFLDYRWPAAAMFPLQPAVFEGAPCYVPHDIPVSLQHTFCGARDTLTKVVAPSSVRQLLDNHRLTEFFKTMFLRWRLKHALVLEKA